MSEPKYHTTKCFLEKVTSKWNGKNECKNE